MRVDARVFLLRVLHGTVCIYFFMCLTYLYYVGITGVATWWLLLALVSLGAEAFAVFVLNKGNCPLTHVQRMIGDDKPFFELFLPPHLAKKAIPTFAVVTWIAIGLLLLRLLQTLV
jgi:hypothetical protein